jgi:outer membrane protein OmpA-like peptidoglycan-associated protein
MNVDIEDKSLLKTRQFAWVAILLGGLGIGTILVNALFSFSLMNAGRLMGTLNLAGFGNQTARTAQSTPRDAGSEAATPSQSDPTATSSTKGEVAIAPKIEPGVIPKAKSVEFKDDQAAGIFSGIPDTPASYEKMLNETLVTKPAEFRPGSAVLTWNGKTNLDQIIPILKAKPEWRFEICSHIPTSDTPEVDRLITERRSEAIAGYLGTEGISNIRMSTKGYGSSRPIADNNTELGRLRNQRVEIRVVSTQ